MGKFTDAEGGEWKIELLRPQLKRVKQELQIDLLDIGNKSLWMRLLNDPELIVDVAWVVLENEIKHRNLDEIAFARRLKGDVLDQVADALLEEVINFFPGRRRAVLRQALQKTRDLMSAQQDHSETLMGSGKLEELTRLEMRDLERQIDERIQELSSGNSSTSGADTSALTRTAKHSAPLPG